MSHLPDVRYQDISGFCVQNLIMNLIPFTRRAKCFMSLVRMCADLYYSTLLNELEDDHHRERTIFSKLRLIVEIPNSPIIEYVIHLKQIYSILFIYILSIISL